MKRQIHSQNEFIGFIQFVTELQYLSRMNKRTLAARTTLDKISHLVWDLHLD